MTGVFRVFKMKVGRDVDDDVRRLEAVHRRYTDVSFVIDPNQGYTREEAACFVPGRDAVRGTHCPP